MFADDYGHTLPSNHSIVKGPYLEVQKTDWFVGCGGDFLLGKLPTSDITNERKSLHSDWMKQGKLYGKK